MNASLVTAGEDRVSTSSFRWQNVAELHHQPPHAAFESLLNLLVAALEKLELGNCLFTLPCLTMEVWINERNWQPWWQDISRSFSECGSSGSREGCISPTAEGLESKKPKVERDTWGGCDPLLNFTGIMTLEDKCVYVCVSECQTCYRSSRACFRSYPGFQGSCVSELIVVIVHDGSGL